MPTVWAREPKGWTADPTLALLARATAHLTPLSRLEQRRTLAASSVGRVHLGSTF